MTAPLTCGAALSAEAYADMRRRMIFTFGKWDPQFSDTQVLAPYPLILSREAWTTIRADAEKLADEAARAEAELRGRPDLQRELGLPGAITRRWKKPLLPARTVGPRLVRFDFHETADGWRISEANSDVPGGLIEAAGLGALTAGASADWTAPGDPAEAIAQGFADLSARQVALVHATAYTDDRQTMEFLAKALQRRGIQGHLVSPTHISWREGRATLVAEWLREPVMVDGIFRFFPAEWLPQLGRRANWSAWLDEAVPHCNPVSALLTQSKRFPLVWDRLQTAVPTWRALLPETRDPRRVDWRNDERWIVKATLGRVGEDIGMRGVTPQRDWRRMVRSVRWRPRHWVAQRRFPAAPIDTPDGPRYPCLGVFVVNGRCCGVYGRISKQPLIDARAQDVAILIARDRALPERPTREYSHAC
jgi:glutathionylspermidine synthase